MKKYTSTEEDPETHVLGVMGASVVAAVGMALFPPFALLAPLILLGRKEEMKRTAERMDVEEMSDTEEIARAWQHNKVPGEKSISISRQRMGGGALVPMSTVRTHTYVDDSDCQD